MLTLILAAMPWIVMLIPIYEAEIALGMLNTSLGLALPSAAFFLPVGVLIMRAAFLNTPAALREAAMLDGASEMQIWFRIMLPLTRPSLAAVMLLTFIACWKEFILAATLNPLPSATTLAVGMTYLKAESQSWAYGTLSAVIILSIVPLLIIFLLFERHIVGGITIGSAKGQGWLHKCK